MGNMIKNEDQTGTANVSSTAFVQQPVEVIRSNQIWLDMIRYDLIWSDMIKRDNYNKKWSEVRNMMRNDEQTVSERQR